MLRLQTLARVLVVLALVASTQGALWVHGAFEVRQDWIAEHLCESRHDPDAECDGMCYLDRKMQEHSDHEDEHGAAVRPSIGVVAVEAQRAPVPPDRWRTDEAPRADDDRRPASAHLEEVFRPPRGARTA